MRGRPRVAPAESTSSIYRASDGRWHAKVTTGRRPDGTPQRKHLSRSTKAELHRAVRDLEGLRDAGHQEWTEDDPLLSRWLEHWLGSILPMTVRWKTLSTYTSLMNRHVLPTLGGLRLSEVRAETLERHYRSLLDSGLSVHVVHGVHRVLRSSLNEAVRRHRLTANPALIARPPRVSSEEVDPLSPDECRQIIHAALSTRQPARWSMALALGLRQGETLGLRWSDVDFDAASLRVRRAVQRQTWKHGCTPNGLQASCGHPRGAECPARHGGGVKLVETKTKASRRTLAVPDPLLEELRRQRRAQVTERLAAGPAWPSDLDLIFPDAAGRPMDPARDWREWKNLLKVAAVRDARLHDARHTAATLMLVQGVDVRTLMAIMGWTEMTTAQRYSHAVDEMRFEAARRIGAVLWQTPAPSQTRDSH